MKVTISHKNLFYFLVFIIISACTNSNTNQEIKVSEQFSIRGFVPLANWKTDSSGKETSDDMVSKSIMLDYTDALPGFMIPSVKQVKDGKFMFTFSIRNLLQKPQRFAYKIYYQNETYSFPLTKGNDSSTLNPYAQENFYGSWEDVSQQFKLTQLVEPGVSFTDITDAFRIVGNPRDEKKYYDSTVNQRWKRNPRVGAYSFMLVVTTEDNLKSIPEYIRDISLTKEGSFINPYYYFLYGAGKMIPNTLAMVFKPRLCVHADLDLSKGIYVNPQHFDPKTNAKYFSDECGQSDEISRNATLEQFIHYIDPGTRFSNIPVIADVLRDNYSQLEYNWNKSFFTKEELISVLPSTAPRPCESVYYDQEGKKVVIVNQKSTFGDWKKQNTGIITRHALTYGKYTVKARLTELINKNGLWNGLTNAIWLITKAQEEWNFRRDCNKEGYMAHYYGGKDDQRVKNMGYSEIDFEILKTVPYCPSYILPPVYNIPVPDRSNLLYWNVSQPEEVRVANDKIVVACTNWDMACAEPSNYNGGCQDIEYQGQWFQPHRWDLWYRAITEKSMEIDDELFASDYYYFQIDWKPEEIIWRIGPEKDKLRVVGYVNSTISSIPNNEMLLIVTQEFHNTKWWIGSPYEQDNVPFPKNDIKGDIYGITIE